jgi:bacillithiol biosynthesis cysteine-adding enzyme BshC
VGTSYRERALLAAFLQEYNAGLGAARAALDAAARLGETGTVAVVAGQQPGLFTGPLYTVHKAAACVALSRRLEEQGIPAVPVFWLASEDHDWDEVNHVYALDASYQLLRLEAKLGRQGTPPSFSLPLPDNRDELIQALISCAPGTGYTSEIEEALRQTSATGGFSQWCARLLSWMFSPAGLVIYDPGQPQARALAYPVMRRAVLRREEVAEEFARGSLSLAGMGYPLQVEKAPTSTHLFYLHQGSRVALHRASSTLVSRSGEVALSQEQLLTCLEQDPGVLSPDVVLRPVVQSAVLPTLAVVAGPGELGYYAQLREVLAGFDHPLPALWARAPLTLVDAAVNRYGERLGLPAAALVDRGLLEQARAARREVRGGAQLRQAFSRLKDTVSAAYAELEAALGDEEPGYGQLVDGNRGRVLEQIAWLEQKTGTTWEKRDEVEGRQWYRVEQACYPRGLPQERVLNPFPFFMRYGRTWLEELCQELLDPTHHHLIYL